MAVEAARRRGRGAQSNAAGRYEPLARIVFDDGWQSFEELPPFKTAVTLDSIQKLVAGYFNIKVVDLKSKNNSRSVSFPRQVAMYLCKNLTEHSLPSIGQIFGGKHHSTVIHAIRKVEERRRQDKDFDRLIRSFLESFE